MRPHLASIVQDWRAHGGETAVVAHRGNRAFRTSYGELAELAGRFATEFASRQIGVGERVILWGENSPEWMAAFFGCLLRGVLAVPLDYTSNAGFIERIVAEVQPKLMVGDASLIRSMRDSMLPTLVFSDVHGTLPRQSQFEVDPAVCLDSPFQIIFTSGTTSEPKGVVHTHRNVLASLGPIEVEIKRYRRYERPFHPLRFLHTLPFSHVFGQFMGLWIPTLLAAQVHLPAAVEPARLLALTRRERISVLVAVPRILELLRDHIVTRFPDLRTQLQASSGIPAWKRWWRFRAVHRALGFKFWALICGGATLAADLEAFWNGLGLALIQGYGMTETAALVTLNHPFHVGKGTIGKALPGRDIRLGPQGEILVRGEMLAAGAWQHGRFQPRTEEWLATGDLATQDASGELRFAGRKGDVIVTAAGLNVHPQDLERVYLAQPGVRGCAVVRCETALGPEPVAVVLFDGGEADLRAILEEGNRQLAAFQQLRYLLRWPEPVFPYTSTGKLLRRRIAEWACAQVQGSRSVPKPGEAADLLLKLVAEITHEHVPTATDSSRLTEDLHLDSLGRVQLQSAIESRFGAEIPDERMAHLETLGQVRALLGQGPAAMVSGAPIDSAAPRPGAAQVAGSSAADRPEYAHWPWSAPIRWLRALFTALVAMPLVRLLAHPRVIVDAEVAEGGPILLIANHVSTYDVPLILYGLPAPLRYRVAPAMSAELLSRLRRGEGQGNPVLDLLARPAYWLVVALFNVFPLPRSSGFRESFAHAGEALDRGYSVLVFPEGTRSHTGVLAPFRPGIGLLVQASGVPVLPIALQGIGSAQRAPGGWLRGPRPAIHVGQPVSFPSGAPPEEITQVLEERLRALGPS